MLTLKASIWTTSSVSAVVGVDEGVAGPAAAGGASGDAWRGGGGGRDRHVLAADEGRESRQQRNGEQTEDGEVGLGV